MEDVVVLNRKARQFFAGDYYAGHRLPERNNGCAPAPGLGWRVGVAGHKRGPAEDLADGVALYADAPAMNDSNVAKAFLVSKLQVLFDGWPDVSREKRVKIEDVGNGNLDRLVHRLTVSLVGRTIVTLGLPLGG